jgi:hypothetical protein
VIPVRKIGDEIEKDPAEKGGVCEKIGALLDRHEVRVGLRTDLPQMVFAPGTHSLARCFEETRGPNHRASDLHLFAAFRPFREIHRVGPERCANDRAACGKRPPGPPNVERRDVAVSDRFLSPRMCRIRAMGRSTSMNQRRNP